MNLFISLLKILLILVLLTLMLGGGACVVLGVGNIGYGDAWMMAAIGLVTLLVSGWLVWLLGRSLGRKPAEPPSAP